MKVVSGHPLLIDAEVDAVKQWKYQPTILDGVPVAVEMLVTVTFSMSS
jgi:protein TonB